MLHVFGAPITQLSTSRVFAWLVERGSSPLSVEWVNDFSCNVVFRDEEAALTGLEKLQAVTQPRAGSSGRVSREDTPTEPGLADAPDPITQRTPSLPRLESLLQAAEAFGSNEAVLMDKDDKQRLGLALLTSRKLKSVPLKLWEPAEIDVAELLLREREQATGQQSDGDAEMAEADNVHRAIGPDDGAPKAPLPARVSSEQREDLRKLTSSLYARFAVEGLDAKKAVSRQQSEWYRRHGYNAGTEVVRLRDVRPDAPPSRHRERNNGARDLLESRTRSRRGRSASPGRGNQDRDERPSNVRGRGAALAPYEKQDKGASGGREKVRGRGRARLAATWSSDEDEDDEANDANTGPMHSAKNVVAGKPNDRSGRY